MPSFDIVSEITMTEVRNAVENAQRECTTRWDFRNILAKIELNEKNNSITLTSESDFQVNQLLNILRDQLAKRGIESNALDIPFEFEHTGKTYRANILLKQGIDRDLSKKIVKLVKDSKQKVQTQIQGEQVRITGKSRDDLQCVITLIKESNLGQPFQFTNFRE